MSNLRNPDLRIKDIRKLISLRSHSIKWDEGLDKKNEWVLITTTNCKNPGKLFNWLHSKNVSPDNECVLTGSNWNEPNIIRWRELLEMPDKYFSNNGFQLYDIDLRWVLEYSVVGVGRFGKFNES